jgi:hypothetical protein
VTKAGGKRLAVGVVLLLAACGGLQPVDPARALRDGGAATATLKSVTATLKFSQGKISFSGYALVSATAAVRLPDQSDTVYKVRQGDVQFALEVVIIAGHVYLRPPFLGFQELTGAQASSVPDLAKLFDANTGLPAVIPAGRNPKYDSAETVDGVDSHKIEATYSADQIRGLLPQLSSVDDVSATVWIGGSDHLIRKAVLSGRFGDNGTASTVEVDMGGFNGAVNIASPARSQ